MFDFAWSQIALIAVVALIAIGPKDMPVAIRAVTGALKKARRMAAEFQTHVDEMMREANLDEVKSQFNDIRNFDFTKEIEKAVDPDGSIRDTFASDPLNPGKPLPEVTVPEAPATEMASADPTPAEVAAEPPVPLAPAFIPPNMVPPPELAAAQTQAEAEPPAFIPPEIVRHSQAKA